MRHLPGSPPAGCARRRGGIAAVQDLSVSFAPGEVHAVVGENGAGKSTLMKLLAGLLQPDAGELLLDGQPVRLRSPHAALRRGIAMIHQELLGFPDLTVAENVLIGCEPTGACRAGLTGSGCVRRPARAWTGWPRWLRTGVCVTSAWRSDRRSRLPARWPSGPGC